MKKVLAKELENYLKAVFNLIVLFLVNQHFYEPVISPVLEDLTYGDQNCRRDL